MQRDLVEAARRGDHDAFEALVIAAADRLYSMARLADGSEDLLASDTGDYAEISWGPQPPHALKEKRRRVRVAR